MDEFKQMLDSIYRWTAKNGEAVPPSQALPDYVLERVDMVVPEFENGLTFIGGMEAIFAEENEAEEKQRWESSSSYEWVPITPEFKNWCNTPLYNLRQMRVAIELIYGPLGKGDEDDG